MRLLIFFTGETLTIMFSSGLPPMVSLFIGIVLFGVIWLVWQRIARTRQRKEDGERIDNVYFVEMPEGKHINLPFQSFLIEYEKRGRMAKTCDIVMNRIKASGNNRGVKPVMFYYQDGEFVNEDIEAYKTRVIEEIQEDRAMRHASFSAIDRSQYLKEQMNERVIDWSHPDLKE